MATITPRPTGRVQALAVANGPDLTVIRGPGESGIDGAAAESAVAGLLEALGQDLSDPQLRETPRRVAAALVEMLSPAAFGPAPSSSP